MQPQTVNAATIAQKIQSCICCIVVFSVAYTLRNHYKAFRVSSLAQQVWQLGRPNAEPKRTKMRDRLAREWPPIPPRRGMQSIGGGQTSSQQRQLQEPSQPQHSRTHKLYFQGPSYVRAPEDTALYNIYRGPSPSLFCKPDDAVGIIIYGHDRRPGFVALRAQRVRHRY
jgi:hypothetical protein